MNELPAENLNEEAPSQKLCYEGMVESTLLSGRAKLTVGEDGIVLDTVFDSVAVSFAEITNIEANNYVITIRTKSDSISVREIGNAWEWCHKELLEAFNAKVLNSLLIEGGPLFTATGCYRYNENERNDEGEALFHVYTDCVCVLPPNARARRIPLLFASGMETDEYCLTLVLSTGERYTFSKLGYDTEGFERQITACIRALREAATQDLRALNETLGLVDATKAARLLPAGIAGSFATLQSAFPHLAVCLEGKILASGMAETWPLPKDLGDEKQLQVGYKPIPSVNLDMNEETDNDDTDESEKVNDLVLWAILPSKNHQLAVVELAIPGEAAATYVFDTEGNWPVFSQKLNQALEASAFQREAFSLPDDKLTQSQYDNLRMRIERTPVIEAVRQNYRSRVIHTAIKSWESSITKTLNSEA